MLSLLGPAALSACERSNKVALAMVDGIPGSVSAPFPGTGQIAFFAGPTAVYGHAIMGRVPEATRLYLSRPDTAPSVAGCLPPPATHVDAGEGHVFEDIAPRLADLDRDGWPEVIAVRASFREGAQLAIYHQQGDGGLTLLAATPYIGTRYRWLAPAAWEDLDGDGHIELAYVDRPHLAKVLRVWRWRNGRLEPVGSVAGVTNHAIGDETIHGYTRNCEQQPEIVLQSADRRRLVGVTLRNGKLAARDLGPADRMEALRTC